jgi:7,8-dihydropterin-6-yl-methyl-4-(beta-D-ribofuranosyl)aminobenzene 5'-phosphate synthase
MLFGTCNCSSDASSISRRSLLCAGGAGFVTALVGTLAAGSRTAEAQALASKPPEVDSLAVRIVTDNQIIKFIPTEKRDGILIERKPGGYLSKDAPLRERNLSPSGGCRCMRSPGVAVKSATS